LVGLFFANYNPAHFVGAPAVNAELVIAWAKVILSGVASVALVPLFLYLARYFWERRRWRAFARLIEAWAQDEWAVDDLTDEDWKAVAATKLFEAGFEPERLSDLVEPAIWFAKGRASRETFGKIGFRKKGS
jgi:hypothetical protein